ncbi:hypothetical protein ILUMI_16842 [Ignelater luminosus]|uniref:Uncharacterized protein n=1 Tax=Ignelater luminosus TaxID=2038154 RepID=A0A8K0CQI4_IGNLU|nr:hypothetical protein ILUMI_16842 [Ignelater luminosus]
MIAADMTENTKIEEPKKKFVIILPKQKNAVRRPYKKVKHLVANSEGSSAKEEVLSDEGEDGANVVVDEAYVQIGDWVIVDTTRVLCLRKAVWRNEQSTKIRERQECNQTDLKDGLQQYQGINWALDHFLVVASIRQRISNVQKQERYTPKKWDIDKLRSNQNLIRYQKLVKRELSRNEASNDVELQWRNIKDTILKAAKEMG